MGQYLAYPLNIHEVFMEFEVNNYSSEASNSLATCSTSHFEVVPKDRLTQKAELAWVWKWRHWSLCSNPILHQKSGSMTVIQYEVYKCELCVFGFAFAWLEGFDRRVTNKGRIASQNARRPSPPSLGREYRNDAAVQL